MLWNSLIEINPETEKWAISREFPFATSYQYESNVLHQCNKVKQRNKSLYYIRAYIISKPIAYFYPLKLPYNLNMLNCYICEIIKNNLNKEVHNLI